LDLRVLVSPMKLEKKLTLLKTVGSDSLRPGEHNPKFVFY
jgi:hypothetical protein